MSFRVEKCIDVLEGVHPERVQKFHDTPHLYLILCLFHQGFPTFILYNEQVIVRKALS